MERVTAIVLNYNSAEDSEKCINFLKKQNYDNLSIVLVDNCSTNNNENEKLKQIEEKYKIKYIKNSKNNGFSAGNNIGIKYALSKENSETDWCLIINPDVELRDSEYIFKVMKENKKWNKSVVIGTDVYLPSGIQQNPMIEKNVYEEIFGVILNRILKKLKKKKVFSTGYCDKLVGCCFFIKSSFIKEINFLDEKCISLL